EKGKQPDSYLYLKFNSSSETALLSDLKASWEQAFPGNPFNYFYLDEFYNQQYQQDQNFFQVFQIFSGLAILVASLGFFGLTFFLATTKVKEIGIRKTLGAEFKDVVAILGKGTVPSLLIAGLISIPFIYFLGNNWLQDYAFRIAIGWWVLLLPLILFGLLTLFIIQIQALRSYRANPIDALQEGGNGTLSR
ncbi:MAG: ABC transporter permease, partial [Cyclobacteriaceae bacterium]|nr:ABC transporter permease [Cyclobacteriaceae bacterium]